MTQVMPKGDHFGRGQYSSEGRKLEPVRRPFSWVFTSNRFWRDFWEWHCGRTLGSDVITDSEGRGWGRMRRQCEFVVLSLHNKNDNVMDRKYHEDELIQGNDRISVRCWVRHTGKSSRGKYVIENRECWAGILERAGTRDGGAWRLHIFGKLVWREKKKRIKDGGGMFTLWESAQRRKLWDGPEGRRVPLKPEGFQKARRMKHEIGLEVHSGSG